MKKRIAALLFVNCILLQQAAGCTTFFINKDGQLIFGRNYDWLTDAGMVCINLRGLLKTSLKADKHSNSITWISRYGSISFNQYRKEFPTGGMNENGLVVEIMWAAGTIYPAADKRPALQLLQWIQYQLDNNAVIDEVIATDKDIRIAADNPPCHFLVADSSGNAATIEFIAGKMLVHRGKDLPFPVFTNSSYAASVKAANDANVLSGNTNFSFQDNSLQRFTRACSMVQQFQQHKIDKPIVDYAFYILKKVAAPGFTRWSIVYDLKNKMIHFKTAEFQDIKSFTLNAFDFACTAPAMVLDMNQSIKGDKNKNFLPFSDAINREITERAVKESQSQLPISNEAKEANIIYPRSIRCNN